MRIYWLIVIVLGLVLVLHWQFPYAVDSTDEKMRIAYLLVLALLVGSGWRMSRLSSHEVVRYAGIWLLIILALMLVYYGFLALGG